MTKATAESNDDEGLSPVAPGKLGEFFAFIKLARTFKGDLSAISAPAFLLSPTSLTEYPSYWGEQPSLFIAPARQKTKDLRALAVLKWYLSTLRSQWGNRGRKRRKPLNPTLGELFLGHWEDDESGRTNVVVEQVSHHPPASAFRIWNEQHRVTMEGYYVQKTFFRGMPHIHRIGHVMVRLDEFDEDYLITLPDMHLEGLFPPPPSPELEGKSFIVGSNGTIAEIEYSGRGWLRGKKNSFQARLFDSAKPEHAFYTLEGQWQGGSFTIYDSEQNKVEEFATKGPLQTSVVVVKPVEEQDPLESRRVWHKVAQAIEKGDLSAVSREKHQIEEEQRAMRRKEKEEGIPWRSRYFEPSEWRAAEELLGKVGQHIRREETKGIWRWIGEGQMKTGR